MPTEPKINILLVDDNPANLLAMEAALEELGENLVTVNSGKKALRLLLDQEFAFVLLDVNMPSLSGFEVAAMMKGIERLRHTPIIFITSMFKDDEHLSKGYAAGAVDYLFTPINPHILRAKVAAFAQHYKLAEKTKRHAEELARLNQQLEQKISEHQRSEEALRQAMSVIEAMQDGVFMSDSNTLRFTYANLGAVAQTGYTQDELLTMTPWQIKPEFDEARYRQLVAPLLAGTQTALTFTTVHRRQDGRDVPVEIILQCVAAEGKARRFIAMVRDISERQQHEEHLHRLLKELADMKLALDESSIVAVTDRRGIITYVNDKFCQISGYSREELIGQDHRIINSGYHPKEFFQHLWMTIARGQVWSGEICNRAKNGALYWVDTTIVPFLNPAGELYQHVAIRSDITERKLFDQQLQEKNLELVRASQAKDRFLASMSHELRTPLNAILGFTGVILMHLAGPLTSDQEEQLRTVQNSGQHLLSLINDMLDLAKIESGKLTAECQPVSCQRVMKEVAATLLPLAEKKGLEFEVITPPQGGVVQADQRLLNQIILNLAGNAIKFTNQGKVQLELGTRQINGHQFATIEVSDTGIGIKPEEQAKMFQAFEQVNLEDRREGTGLGLYLSQKLAHLMKGQIEFESQYGRGSVFRLVIPTT